MISKVEKHCVNCGTEISRRATRCNPCATKKRWERGVYGEEYRRKKSKAAKAAWERGDLGDEEWRRKNSEATKARWRRGDLGNEECRRKMSEGVTAAWRRGDYDDIFGEEHRRKMSEVTEAAWKRGVYDDLFGKEHRHKLSEATEAAWKRGDYDGAFRSPTSIELQVAAALDIMGIEHTSQYRPRGCSRTYDEYVPPNALIEVQGDYFHSEEHFPGIQERDAKKAQWATENGFELVEIWEHEIKARGAWAIVAQTFICRA